MIRRLHFCKFYQGDSKTPNIGLKAKKKFSEFIAVGVQSLIHQQTLTLLHDKAKEL